MVVDAVRCAVEVQRGMAARNAEVLQDKRIEFRVGINVGDVIIEEDDIYGDGVNIAARLETLAPRVASVCRLECRRICGTNWTLHSRMQANIN